LRTPGPDPLGRYRISNPWREGPFSRRFEAAENPVADRLAAGLAGIADQGRGAGDSHTPSAEAAGVASPLDSPTSLVVRPAQAVHSP
jgi:hypothetical protein